MKNVFFLLFVLFIFGCSQKREVLNLQGTPDLIYHYNNKSYPLYFVEGTEDVIEDENYKALNKIAENSDVITVTFPEEGTNQIYWFDSEFAAYDYVEQTKNPVIGRKFKVEYRITELRERLLAKYGDEIRFDQPQVKEEALKGVRDIYTELKIDGEFPRDLNAFIGIKGGQLSPDRNPVLRVYENYDFTGSEMIVESAPNTAVWTHGNYGCFTTAANPDLTLEVQPNGNNWNDVISARCFIRINGADAMALGFYKDINYAKYRCGYNIEFYFNNTSPGIYDPCYAMYEHEWDSHGFLSCSNMDEQISSIRIKAVWRGCPQDFNDL